MPEYELQKEAVSQNICMYACIWYLYSGNLAKDTKTLYRLKGEATVKRWKGCEHRRGLLVHYNGAFFKEVCRRLVPKLDLYWGSPSGYRHVTPDPECIDRVVGLSPCDLNFALLHHSDGCLAAGVLRDPAGGELVCHFWACQL